MVQKALWNPLHLIIPSTVRYSEVYWAWNLFSNSASLSLSISTHWSLYLEPRQCSWYSSSLQAGQSGFESRQEQEIFLFSKIVHPGSGSSPTLLSSGLSRSFPRVKQLGHEVYHSFHPVPRIRMSGTIPLLHLYSFMEWTDAALHFHHKYLSSFLWEKGRNKVGVREILGLRGCYYSYI